MIMLKKKKKDLTISWLKETDFKSKDTNRLEGWKMIYHASSSQKKVLDKADLRAKNNPGDKEVHFYNEEEII